MTTVVAAVPIVPARDLPATAGWLQGVLLAAVCVLVVAAPAPAAEVDVIGQAASGVTLKDARAAAKAAGMTPGPSLRSIRAFRMTGPRRSLRALRRTGRIGRVEPMRYARLGSDTSHKATRGFDVRSGTPAFDGRGVGIGIVDSGADSTHPDLAGNLATNVRMVDDQAVPITESDAIGGHGTHVAGIAAGTGAASGGRYTGAAPRASLHVFSVGIGPSHSINPFWAWDWILLHNHELTTPIRVINNSFGGGGQSGYDPDYFEFQLIDKLIASGVTMVFAAGNHGGDGRERMTSTYCLDPTPGVICVASYDDADRGTLSGSVADHSSRGKQGEQLSYPDLMAPGVGITAPCRPYMGGCLIGVPSTEFPLEYARKSGTSMAAPHVAGIVAQLIQARPDLTPAQVEGTLVETARPVETGADYEPDQRRPGITSFDKGHGLVDVRAAVDRLLAPPASSPASPAPPAPGPGVAPTPGPGVAPAPIARPVLHIEVKRRGRRLVVRIADPAADRATVRVRRGRQTLQKRTVRLAAGRASVRLRVPHRAPLRIEVRAGGRVARASA